MPEFHSVTISFRGFKIRLIYHIAFFPGSVILILNLLQSTWLGSVFGRKQDKKRRQNERNDIFQEYHLTKIERGFWYKSPP